jgi:hypothetical protein
MIEVFAGQTALKTIENEGFRQDLFSNYLGASGGPKWFCLMELDKYLVGDFFKGRTTKLNLIGSSAGAFRMACLAQRDPVFAIEKFANLYAESVFPDTSTPSDITIGLGDMLDGALGPTGIEEVISNPIFKAHFIVAKVAGLVSREHKLLQSLGLLKSFLNNIRGRKYLRSQYERILFSAPGSVLSFQDPYNIPSRIIALSRNNLKPALLASGSIPLLMDGVRNIPQSPQGMYRDGGIVDYHFDLSFEGHGLTLYPHFSQQPFAGWFDKSIKRKVRLSNYDKTVFIRPSKTFIESLPFKKIPDRKDFSDLGNSERISYWKKVLLESKKIADSFSEIVQGRDTASYIRPIENIFHQSKH